MKKLIIEANVSEVELIYKSKVAAKDKPRINNSKDAYELFLHNWDLYKIELVEHFKIAFLNRANKVNAIIHVSSGGVTGTIADPRIIFGAALKINASSLILAHNHPSGDLSPSNSDIELTQKLKTAGKYLDLKVLDHLIIHQYGYYSFADEGDL